MLRAVVQLRHATSTDKFRASQDILDGGDDGTGFFVWIVLVVEDGKR